MYLLKVLTNKCKEKVLKMKIDISKTIKKISKQKWVNYLYKMKTTSKQIIKVKPKNQFKLKFNLKKYD